MRALAATKQVPCLYADGCTARGYNRKERIDASLRNRIYGSP
jgi:hypothetical protein